MLLVFLKTNLIVQILIIAGVVILFFIVTILNTKTKAPKDVKLNEKCVSCTSTTCMIKLSDVNKIKEEMRQEILKNECENKENKDERQN